MKTSESIKSIAAALNKSQGEMVGAIKASKNPFFKSSYSSLTDVMQAIAKPFHANGLSFAQAAEFDEGMVTVSTRIMHSSGEWLESTTALPPVKQDPQAYGSAITYAKRYGLQALAGVPSVDDDAQFASASSQEHSQEIIDKTLSSMIELIDANDIAFTQVWHEMDRVEQSQYWGLLNTKQKKVARELINQTSVDEAT